VPEPADLPLLKTHHIAVGSHHRLLAQEFGAPDGRPAVVLHGGPGSGSSPLLRRGFDPHHWRVVCIDQRGCGGSTPRGDIVLNTTAHLLDDLRRVRQLLGIGSWLVSGGSWGATLALAHAAAEPQAVTGLLLRSSFLGRREDIDAFFGPPAAAQRPRAWQRLTAAFGMPLLPNLAHALHQGPPAEQERAAAAWWAWEQALGHGVEDPPALQGEALARQVHRLQVQAHYLLHDCWLTDPPLPALRARVPRVPTVLLHARDDGVCPAAGALALHAALPHATLRWLDAGGHDASHPAMQAANAEVLARFAEAA
jgi:proline iminopeptidase